MGDKMAFQEISAAIGGLKAATEIAKVIVSAKGAMDVAEFRLKAADLMTSLAEARVSLVDAQDRAEGLQDEISRLKEALEAKQTLVKVKDGYYAVDENGNPVGEAFCLRCWEVDHNQRHLTYPLFTDKPTVCAACMTEYTQHNTQRKTAP
jgi:hypothetical protein